jgi:tRNA(Ile2) C34 agmatinyltransferase TiaS
MRVYVGFDDTDTVDADRGTGKLARWFEQELPEGCLLWGVVRQQLLIDPAIPYTSHNSAAVAVVDVPDASYLGSIATRAAQHIEKHAISGSDPGLCVAAEGNGNLSNLIEFGKLCATRVVTKTDAVRAAAHVFLSGHGGTHDGIIGAAAGVGLTASGWSGRFIEFKKLRNFPELVRVADLEGAGIVVVSVDRDAPVPGQDDMVDTNGWLRPRLWGARPTLPVTAAGKKLWQALASEKRRDKNKQEV